MNISRTLNRSPSDDQKLINWSAIISRRIRNIIIIRRRRRRLKIVTTVIMLIIIIIKLIIISSSSSSSSNNNNNNHNSNTNSSNNNNNNNNNNRDGACGFRGSLPVAALRWLQDRPSETYRNLRRNPFRPVGNLAGILVMSSPGRGNSCFPELPWVAASLISSVSGTSPWVEQIVLPLSSCLPLSPRLPTAK